MTNCIDAHYNKVLKMTICNNCTEGRPPFCHDIGFNENERKTALCDLMDCGMFGICVLQGEHAVCECEEKFATGLLCDNITESVLCEKVTCYHDGTCRKVGDSQAKCVCMEGYTGEVCAQDVNECNYAPCGEYGTCTNSFGSYICQCRNGESGRTCPEESQMAGIIHERAVYGTVGGMLLFIVVSVVVILYEWRKKRKENKRLQKMTPNAPRTPSAEPPTPNAQNQAARTS
uniref:EGF-like domain-containing protein n=1 Tax=Trichuris muris TaxID=70415 RepID=A0A5S6Q3Z5_TRIMR